MRPSTPALAARQGLGHTKCPRCSLTWPLPAGSMCPACYDWNDATTRPVTGEGLPSDFVPKRRPQPPRRTPGSDDPYARCRGCGEEWDDGDDRAVHWFDTDNGVRFRFQISHERCAPIEVWVVLQGRIDWAFCGPPETA